MREEKKGFYREARLSDYSNEDGDGVGVVIYEKRELSKREYRRT